MIPYEFDVRLYRYDATNARIKICDRSHIVKLLKRLCLEQTFTLMGLICTTGL